MNQESKTAPQEATQPAKDPRKVYAPPQLRSLGTVNAITLASGTSSRGKPHG